MVGMICLMSWMFKRNLELDKDTQELVKKIIRTIMAPKNWTGKIAR